MVEISPSTPKSDIFKNSFLIASLKYLRYQQAIIELYTMRGSEALPLFPNFEPLSPLCAGRDAEAFAIVNDLSQLISEPTRIPDRSGDKANTLDLFLTSNPDIYCNPILDSSHGNSDHCLITLQHNFVSHQDRSSSSQKIFHYSKAD